MDNSHSIRSMERALDELRRGYAVRLRDADSALLVQAAECAILGENKPLTLALSARRAEYLGLSTGTGEGAIIAINAGQESLLEPLLYAAKLDIKIAATPARPLERAATELVKLAGFLPAALILPDAGAETDVLEVTPQCMKAYLERPVALKLDNVVRLPIAMSEDTRLAVFQEVGAFTHLAILIGRPEADASPLVRLHSACFTGDILGSLRCDCGTQLQAAIAAMAEAGSGMLLYLNQEGRGIGLLNKLRAYRLQEEGLDTVDANLALGFAEDERDFAVAAEMLRLLGIPNIRLLTNNPRKVEALEREGITITGRAPLVVEPGKHNRDYLATKAKRLGHKH